MQNKTKENDVNTLVKYDMPWPCLNILPNCDHTKIMCPNCAHQTGMLYPRAVVAPVSLFVERETAICYVSWI